MVWFTLTDKGNKMHINDLVKQTGETNKEKGWRDIKRSQLEDLALVVTEVAEAMEEVRHGDSRPAIYQFDRSRDDYKIIPHSNVNWDNTQKPEGVAIELADAVIRIMDMFDNYGWDLEQALKVKMDYNKTRSYRHGNKKY